MADLTTLINGLKDVIKTNSQQSITGDVLQGQLLAIINSLNTVKADKATTYTKTEVNTELAKKADKKYIAYIGDTSFQDIKDAIDEGRFITAEMDDDDTFKYAFVGGLDGVFYFAQVSAEGSINIYDVTEDGWNFHEFVAVTPTDYSNLATKTYVQTQINNAIVATLNTSI